ncbi:MAG: hypothetical protein ACJ72D_20205 [Marmoricola sp.]
MVASVSARTRKAREAAGPLADVAVSTGDTGALVHKFRCRECVVRKDPDVYWSSYRSGEDNGYIAAIDRWVLHLVGKHPGATAPCLDFVAEARERAVQRRDERTAGS